jgi:hypothetical protein
MHVANLQCTGQTVTPHHTSLSLVSTPRCKRQARNTFPGDFVGC